MEASTDPSLPALFPGGGGFLSSTFAGFSLRGRGGGGRCFLPCITGSWFPSSVLGFLFLVLRFRVGFDGGARVGGRLTLSGGIW